MPFRQAFIHRLAAALMLTANTAVWAASEPGVVVPVAAPKLPVESAAEPLKITIPLLNATVEMPQTTRISMRERNTLVTADGTLVNAVSENNAPVETATVTNTEAARPTSSADLLQSAPAQADAEPPPSTAEVLVNAKENEAAAAQMTSQADADAESLNALSPAAGAADAQTPLIALPDNPVPRPRDPLASEAPPSTTPPLPVTTTTTTTTEVTTPAQPLATPPLAADEPSAVTTETASPTTSQPVASQPPTQQAAPVEPVEAAPSPAPVETQVTTQTTTVAKPALKPKPRPKPAKRAIVEAPLAPPVIGEDGEPVPTLSPQSQAVLHRTPSGLDAPKRALRQRISIDRRQSKDSDLFSVDGSLKKHEALGIKIEVKKPSMDMNYELNKAYNAMISGQSNEAIDIYRNILAADADNKGALFGIATAYHRAGQLEKARGYYAKLLRLDPDNRDAINNFLALVSEEAPHDALSELTAIAARNPNFAPAAAQVASLYQRLDNLPMASEWMVRAIELAPENLAYRYNLAVIMDKQHKDQEAIALYRQIIDANIRGEKVPGNIDKIQQRLTFLLSNKR